MHRWWPQGRVVAFGIDSGFHVVINQYEHLKLEWTIQQGAYVSSFHKFFKALNSFHKFLKRKQLGGFWKDPKYGYISGLLNQEDIIYYTNYEHID